VQAIAASAVVGTWGLPGIAREDASVTLTRDGTWTAKTTCQVLGNADGGGGAYRLLPTGVLLATEGAIGGTGCVTPDHALPENANAVLDFWNAGSLARQGSRLTVYDRAGKLLGTLVRKS
jgi:hypothetical protein